MKRLAALLAVCVAVAASTTKAAVIYSVTATPQGANTAYSLYMNTNGVAMNGIDMQATPSAGQSFLNPGSGLSSGAPRPAGQAFTYRNRFLDLDPADPDNPGGKGWTLVAPTTTAALVTISGGPLGGTINSASDPGGKIFLANFLLPNGATGQAVMKAVNGAPVVDTQTVPIGQIPEPATLGLAGMSLVGLLAASRRRA
jgi:hypothetical protein